jgi:hypothetical protein
MVTNVLVVVVVDASVEGKGQEWQASHGPVNGLVGVLDKGIYIRAHAMLIVRILRIISKMEDLMFDFLYGFYLIPELLHSRMARATKNRIKTLGYHYSHPHTCLCSHPIFLGIITRSKTTREPLPYAFSILEPQKSLGKSSR